MAHRAGAAYFPGMRIFAAALFLLLAPPGSTRAQSVDFTKDVQPLLQSRCMPCHFQGGKMYASLPFDKPETIVKLGDKVFTRIKDPQSQALIRRFLAQSAKR
jgi:hypothetical protein